MEANIAVVCRLGMNDHRNFTEQIHKFTSEFLAKQKEARAKYFECYKVSDTVFSSEEPPEIWDWFFSDSQVGIVESLNRTNILPVPIV